MANCLQNSNLDSGRDPGSRKKIPARGWAFNGVKAGFQATPVPLVLVIALVLSTMLWPSVSLAQGDTEMVDANVDLRRDMAPETFTSAGLHRLSAQELAALNRWLQGRRQPRQGQTVAASPAQPMAAEESVAGSIPKPTPGSEAQTTLVTSSAPVPASGRKVAAPPSGDLGSEQLRRPKPAQEAVAAIATHIRGEFRGWEGKTVLRLANGQVWQQRVRGRYRYRADAPEVRVERGRFGYYLVLVATDRQIGVKRIK